MHHVLLGRGENGILIQFIELIMKYYMRKYPGVEMEIVEFDLDDVVRTSGEIDNIGDGTVPQHQMLMLAYNHNRRTK